MSSYPARTSPGLQKPPTLPVIVMTDVAALRAAVREPCAACGGRLWFTPPLLTSGYVSCLACSIETATVLEVVRAPIDFSRMPRAPQGRPAKVPPIVSPPTPTSTCIDCGTRRAKSNRPRCRPCGTTRRVEDGKTERVLAILESAKTRLSSREIAARAGMTPCAVRHLIARVRDRGFPIVTVGKGYEMGVAS